MPRAARKKSESKIYHVMLRGINRQVIFQDDEDHEKYLQCLTASQTASRFTLHAYCLMGNHLHLLIQEGPEPLELIFKRIGTRYVYWYNWKYQRTGHLFQDRFKSEPVDDDAYFLAVLRYIYQNPVKAGLCKKPEEYPWSSCHTLGSPNTITDHSKALELLSEAELRAFVETPCEERFLDIEDRARLNDREAAEVIKNLCGISTLTNFHLFDIDEQASYIRAMHKERCSIRQIARLLEISKGRIERILKA